MELPLATSSFEILSKPAYFADLIKRLDTLQKGDRALITTMTLDPTEPSVQNLVESLANAAERGATVDFAFDAYCYLMHPLTKRPGPLYISGKLPTNPTGIYAALAKIRDRIEFAGGHTWITNIPRQPRSNPYSGRSHIKTAVINDNVFIGGCNLSNTRDIDTMIRFGHATTAQWLYSTMIDAVHNNNIHESVNNIDQQYPVDSTTTLLLDAGVRGQSAIYEHALRMIDEAQEWLTITCQFFPNSTTAARLLAAHRRGVRVKVVYNHPYKHGGLHHKILQSMVRERERLRMPKSFFAHQLPLTTPFMHAKIIASEQGAIVGSHNYVKAGVQFGTAELALVREDPAFSHLLVKSIEDQIAS